MRQGPAVRRDQKEFAITPIRGSGNGGQDQNKVSTKLRLKHRPTGLWSLAAERRDRRQNLKAVLRELCDQLVPWVKSEG
jgi:protein subunit release factor B